MKRIAMILNNTVDNIAVWDGESDWNPTEGHELIDVTDHPTVGVGDAYDPATGEFTKPVEVPEPPSLETQLDSIFQSLDLATQAKFYPLKAGIKQAFADGNLAAVRAMVAGAIPSNQAETQAQADMLAKIDAEVN